jgi:Cys-rich protein (TIGR04453 family)
MLPFYVFVCVITVFAGVRRLTGWNGSDPVPVQADCEKICGRFVQCMAAVAPADQFQRHSFILSAGCRNGCAKQGQTMGDCFSEGATCPQIAQCIGGKLH